MQSRGGLRRYPIRRRHPDKVASHRVTCLDRLFFTDQGDIKPVVMTK